MNRLIQQLEAVLFSSGKKMTVDALAEMMHTKRAAVESALSQLKSEYGQRDTALMLINEGEEWKITVREEHMPLVRSIVAETELPKAVLETLAVIAWRAPILQSDIIKIRNNKAYDHIQELEESEFIAKERYGRSYKIKLTQKFHEYFDIDDIKKLQRQMEPKELPKKYLAEGIAKEAPLPPDVVTPEEEPPVGPEENKNSE
jgi:segregation and condensation protein B